MLCLLLTLAGGLAAEQSVVSDKATAEWKPQLAQVTAHFRGLCAVDQNVVWASGTEGTFLRTTNGGETWHAGKVAGAEGLDFRDVEARDDQTAWLLSSGNGSQSRIYKT